MENKLIESFAPSALGPQPNWLNEFLTLSLDSHQEIKQNLNKHFDACIANDYDYGIKKFTLEGWCGNEVNPTLEIVQVEGEFKFASTHYGVLSPLSQDDCNKPPIKKVLMDFFINPAKYFKKKN